MRYVFLSRIELRDRNAEIEKKNRPRQKKAQPFSRHRHLHDNEVSGRVYNNREKAEKFAARQKRSPFVNNLPEKHRSRWGEGLTADDMKKCVWVRPELVAQIEFLEWTESDHLRHSKFVGLRDDKDPRSVFKEQGG